MYQDLPVYEIIPALKEELNKRNIAILQAPPGAGKSTVLPLELLNEPWLGQQKIIMLEPRRLAARSVASRMAALLNEKVGETVGYRIRFENKISSKTRIEVVTEGILTRMLQSDSTLENIGLVIFDEFHERSLHADLALAFSYQSQQILREDLRLLIMSATLDGDKLSALLNNAPVINSTGRQFPVKIKYTDLDPEAPLQNRMVKAIRKALAEETGDILAFLPGTGEILRTNELLEAESLPAIVYPLYGELSFQKQQEAIEPHPQGLRKVVLATSIAETSLTIEGVSIVIDSGYARVPRFDARTGLTKLITMPVTKDAADQRAGRAGRLGPGTCYRLWSEGKQMHLVAHRSPEILEADLAPLMLELYKWGISDILELSWLTNPPQGAVNQARELLEQLEAVKEERITEKGKEILRMPVHPRIGHLLMEATEKDSDKTNHYYRGIATDIAAILEERDPLNKEAGVDITLRIEALRKYRKGERVNADKRALDRIEQMALALRKLLQMPADNAHVSETDAGELLFAAYPERIARQTEKNQNRYRLANGRFVKLPPHDALLNEAWLSVAHLDAGTNEGKIFMAAAIDPDAIMHLAKEYEVIQWDEQREMVAGTSEKRVGSVVLESKPLSKIDPGKRISVICGRIKLKGLPILGWTEEQSNWQARVMSIKQWRPDEDWPDVSTLHLLNTVEYWLTPYLNSISKLSELRNLNYSEILTSLLPWELQRRLDVLAPAKIQVPSGSNITIKYFEDGSKPEMAVRLQEMFGLMETPSVNEGKVKLLLHLLSPAYRPVQITQDLKSFWQNTYSEVRKDLRGRYPKHHWPEDPYTAEAVRGVKRKDKK